MCFILKFISYLCVIIYSSWEGVETDITDQRILVYR